jgi:hypothetical protein
MRDNKSLLLALLAGGLIITWVYHIYDKTQYSNRAKEVFVNDSSAVARAISDSLRAFFIHTLDQLDPAKIQVDTGNGKPLDSSWMEKFGAINQLRNDIRATLEQKDISQEKLNAVKKKIDTLQIRMIDLEREEISLNENKKPEESVRVSDEVTTPQNKKVEAGLPKNNSKKTAAPPLFVASGIHFAAYKVQPDSKEVETTQQNEASKFISSFTVRNSLTGFPTAEIIVVVSDPSGKSVNPEVWDAGSFETKSEGRKIYTRKVRFEYNKGEPKHLSFSLEPENFEKGTYKLTLYHNGVRIGVSSWKLS